MQVTAGDDLTGTLGDWSRAHMFTAGNDLTGTLGDWSRAHMLHTPYYLAYLLYCIVVLYLITEPLYSQLYSQAKYP